MKKVFLENGQRMVRRILDWFQLSKEETDKDRRGDFSDAGILADALDEFNIVEGDNNNPPVTHSINVTTGIAYDSNGERIIIDDDTIPYDPAAPSSTSSDGKGGTVTTPKSTGSLNVTLTANVVNYIYITYLAVRDTDDFTLQKVTDKLQYYKQTDGYEIAVTTTPTPPDPASIYLGSVDLTGGGVVSPSTISLSSRPYTGNKLKRTKIKVPKADRSDATVSYTPEHEGFLDEHVKAVGTGTISASNPHGLDILDLGFNPEETISNHQIFLHSNGIIGDPVSTTSSLYASVVPTTPGEDYIIVKSLITGEAVHVNGVLVTSTDIPSDVSLLFSSTTDTAGTYYIYLDKNTRVVKRTTTAGVPPTADTSLLLWSLTWTPGASGPPYDGDITDLTDLRIFGTTDNTILNNEDDYEVNRLLTHDGSPSAPAYSFRSEPNTGMSLSGSNVLSLSVNGTEQLSIDPTKISSTVQFESSDFGYRFSNDSTMGMRRGSSNTLELITGNSPIIRLDDSAQEVSFLGSSYDLVFNPFNASRSFQIRNGAAINMYNASDSPAIRLDTTTSPDDRWGIIIKPSDQNALQIRTSDGQVVKPLNSSFFVHSINLPNYLGDSNFYDITWNTGTVEHDVNGDFNPSTGKFTAPITGKYLFDVYLTVFAVNGAEIARQEFYIGFSRGGTPSGSWFARITVPSYPFDARTYSYSHSMQRIIHMEQGQTMKIRAKLVSNDGVRKLTVGSNSAFCGTLLG